MNTKQDESPAVVVARARAAKQALIDRLMSEGLMTTVAAARAEGISIGPKQAIRWSLHGAHGVRLESIRVGGRRMTSRQAFRRFVVAQNSPGSDGY